VLNPNNGTKPYTNLEKIYSVFHIIKAKHLYLTTFFNNKYYKISIVYNIKVINFIIKFKLQI